MYYDKPGGRRPIRYLDWRNGLLEHDLHEFEEAAEAELSRLCRTLHTFYKNQAFTSDDFTRHFEQIQDETDLVILDLFSHIDTDDSNENRGAKKIAHAIWNCTQKAKKPIVIVGNLRKIDQKFAPIVPNRQEFLGSIALINSMTKIVMIAPDYETDMADPVLWSTFMQISKCRTDSTLERYTARLTFDMKLNNYREEYTLGRIVNAGKKWQELDPGRIPAWKSDPRTSYVDRIPVSEEAE
jgi:hypothetical protein